MLICDMYYLCSFFFLHFSLFSLTCASSKLINKGSCLYAGSFAGLGFLAWYLSGKIRAFDQRGHIAKLCIVFLPLLVAALVGVTRVDDYWHHWQDVFAGGLLGQSIQYLIHLLLLSYDFFFSCLIRTFCAGLTIASFCYLQFFPAPYHIDGMAHNIISFLESCAFYFYVK